MNRPSRDFINLEIAKLIASRGACGRMKVGCVITKDGRIISTGYNGPLPSEDLCYAHCNVSQPCDHAIHAEQNAIAFAASEGINLFGATLYCTHGPCLTCARLIVQVGIFRVIYLEPYRSSHGIITLRKANIETELYEPTKDSKKPEGDR